MHNSFVLGISVGESFAEYSLLADSTAVAQKRVYLSHEPLKTSLLQFISGHADKKIAQAFVALRIPKRLLDFRFSGAVAHLTTAGFEHWLSLTESSKNLTESELLFSVQERVLANGTLETTISNEELEVIAHKLKERNCKQVCLHFLHANKNPRNIQAAQRFLVEQNFEVFIPEFSDRGTEIERWNRNALRATVSSVFIERRNELLQALTPSVPEENVFFLDSAGNLHPSMTAPNIGSLFCISTALGLAFGKPENADVLHLGFEGFWLISNSQWMETWQSAWGPVEMKHLQMQSLSVQPTLGLHLNIFNHFDFSSQQEGWEPGPMFLGRGQKLTLLDLWAENEKLTSLPGLTDRFSPAGIQRFRNAIFALSKTTRSRNNDFAQVTKELQDLTLQRVALETFLHRKSDKLRVTGPLAPMFASAFKKDPKTFIETRDFSEAQATALWGFRALEGNS